MSWQISGTYYSACSCNVGCPCTLGELEGDRGWCSGALVFDIASGAVEGTDVGGTRVALAADWPSGFLSGNGTGRIYFDTSLSGAQRTALEGVMSGQKGGVFAEIGTLLSGAHPSVDADIALDAGEDETKARVGDVGEVVVKTLRGPSGERTLLLHAAAAFRDAICLANGRGSSWRDPEMRAWESGGHGEFADFDWSG